MYSFEDYAIAIFHAWRGSDFFGAKDEAANRMRREWNLAEPSDRDRARNTLGDAMQKRVRDAIFEGPLSGQFEYMMNVLEKET